MFWRDLSTLHFLGPLFVSSENTQSIIFLKSNTFNHPYRNKPKLVKVTVLWEEKFFTAKRKGTLHLKGSIFKTAEQESFKA